jgi:hypothetical protein
MIADQMGQVGHFGALLPINTYARAYAYRVIQKNSPEVPHLPHITRLSRLTHRQAHHERSISSPPSRQACRHLTQPAYGRALSIDQCTRICLSTRGRSGMKALVPSYSVVGSSARRREVHRALRALLEVVLEQLLNERA